MKNKFIALLVIIILGLAGIIFFFYYFGHHDGVALSDFSVAYQNYDRSISDLSATAFSFNFEGSPTNDDLAQIADQALADLTLKSSARISSLTKHDAELMSLMQEIADLSGKELPTLKAYQSAMAANDPDLEQLSKELQDLNATRQAAYARFHELSGY